MWLCDVFHVCAHVVMILNLESAAVVVVVAMEQRMAVEMENEMGQISEGMKEMVQLGEVSRWWKRRRITGKWRPQHVH